MLEDTAHRFGPDTYVRDPANPSHPTSFDRGHGLVDVTAALSRVLRRPAPAWRWDGSMPDPEGDARDVGQFAPRAAPVSDPGLDITRASITADIPARVLRFEVRLADLGAGPPSGSTGDLLLVAFKFRGVEYEVRMTRAAGKERFVLQQGYLATSRAVVADDLEGDFDAVSDVVTAEVPLDALHRWDADLPVLSPGHTLTEIYAEAKRFVGADPTEHPYMGTDVVGGRGALRLMP